MIQEKINQMLGVDALVVRGLQGTVKEQTDFSREGTQFIAGLHPEGDKILELERASKNVPNDIVSQMREIKRQSDIRKRIIQSMQAKGQASVMQEQAFKSLYNDLAKEDTQSLSRNVANALRKGEKNG